MDDNLYKNFSLFPVFFYKYFEGGRNNKHLRPEAEERVSHTSRRGFDTNLGLEVIPSLITYQNTD